MGFLGKVDEQGEVVWARTVGSAGYYFNGVAFDSEGNLYHGGIAVNQSPFGVLVQVLEPSSVFLAKLNSEGELIWETYSHGISLTFSVVDVTIDASGYAYMAGTFSSETFGFDQVTLTNRSTSSDAWSVREAFLARFDSDGQLSWLRGTGGDVAESSYAVATDADGNAYQLVQSNSEVMHVADQSLTNSHPPISPNQNAYHGALAVYNPQGGLVKLEHIESGYDLGGMGVAVDAPLQNVYTAWAYGPYDTHVGDFQFTSQGSNDVLIAKLALSPKPRLEIQRTPGWVHVQWDTTDPFHLEWSDALGAAAMWVTNAEPVFVSGTTNTVNLPITANRRFYRLQGD